MNRTVNQEEPVQLGVSFFLVITLKKTCRFSVLCQPSRLCDLSVVWPAGGYSQVGAVDSRAITDRFLTRHLGQKQRQTYKYKLISL